MTEIGNRIPAQSALRCCNGCRESKPLTEFGRNSSRADGTQTQCKLCARAACKKWHAANLEHNKERSKAWRQQNHEHHLAYWADYYRKNADVLRAKRAQWRILNPDAAKAKDAKENAKEYKKFGDKIRARVAAWKANNPDKINSYVANRRALQRKIPGSHTADDIAFLMRIQGGKCAHSWCRANIKGKRHTDHVKPIALGGSNDRKNIQLLCVPCNLAKNATHPVDFALRHGVLV